MFWNLLCEKNNLQMQLSDFEDEESIKSIQTIIKSFKFKNKSIKRGFCKHCGSYKLIRWGGYGRNVRHMYAEIERVRARRFRCKTCGTTFTVLPNGVTFYLTIGTFSHYEPKLTP